MRTKGGETRGLIRFGAELAQEHYDTQKTDRSHTLSRVFALLYDAYSFVSAEVFDAQAFGDSVRQFLVLYSSLGGADDVFWAVKPKFHLMQELAEFQCADLAMSPRDFWCYQDESFVGWVATFAGSRGGANNADSSALRTIQRYRAWIREL